MNSKRNISSIAGAVATLAVLFSVAACGNETVRVPELIAYISTICPLAPGDVIVTGTPGGVGLKRTPPLWMRPGDTVEVDISGIGTLRNPVMAEPA